MATRTITVGLPPGVVTEDDLPDEAYSNVVALVPDWTVGSEVAT